MLITTTPKPLPALRALVKAPGTIVIRGRTIDNAANLPGSFLDDVLPHHASRSASCRSSSTSLNGRGGERELAGGTGPLALSPARRVISLSR
jgi:phage terminase large subunit-like protein